MLIVPTTPIASVPHLPDFGGRTGVCLDLNADLGTLDSKGEPAAIEGSYGLVRSRPSHRPSSKNP